MKNEKALLQDKRDLLKRQYERLQRNFKLMVKDSEEADQMLDWLNEIKRKIQRIEKQLNEL
jgi:ATP-dependent RNA circularization protein (DNA/RNA ligase family)